MIDHVAALVFNADHKLLVLRKKTTGDRVECILPGGEKRNGSETDEETLRRELQEELDVEIECLTFFKEYFDKAIFEEGMDFRQRTYIVQVQTDKIKVKNEIKEAFWISADYEKEQIVCNPTLQNQIIPDLQCAGYLEEKTEVKRIRK